jgi:multiple sugar transport system permease protein
LAAHYGVIATLNSVWKARYASFAQIDLPKVLRPDSAETRDYGEFIAKTALLSDLSVSTPENGFRESLLREFGTVSGINAALGTRARTLTDIGPASRLDDAEYVVSHSGELRKHDAGRNYSQVLDYILLHGQSLWNTAIFCIAAVVTALIVNPLCAYALSRFNLPYAYGILLFVLATMAFPGEVVMIPNFLLLKELGLLNTFAALVLPGMASGFSIFLLKGFFDSLPSELYEAGTIDGASELRMFFKVTIPMSKPIFAVIALGAFTAAYGAFMFALLVCQNPKMWTLMVWLYDLQGSAPQYVMMAALTLAALPTLIVFAFAQKVIMRGIIIPMEK